MAPRRRRVIVWLLAGALVAGLLSVVALVATREVNTATKWAGIVTALMGFVAAGLAAGERVGKWLVGAPRTAGITREELDAAAQRLAEAVRGEWEEEFEVRRLRERMPFSVRWSDLSDHDDKIFGGTAPGRDAVLDRRLGPGRAFRRLPQRRLVILGPSGSGKTVFALTLLLDLVRAREPGDPVPVVFPIGTWNPRRQHLRDWMVEHLEEVYQIHLQDHRTLSPHEELVDQGRLLPILDGLDEIAAESRPGILRHLNAALGAGPVVLTCREAEYRECFQADGVVVDRAAALLLEPIDIESVIGYLTRTTAPPRVRDWDEVFARLRDEPGAPLAAMLRTPLMTWLARAVYGESQRDPGELLRAEFADPDRLARHLIEQLIPTLYPDARQRRRDRARRWHTDDVSRWLAFLARHISGRGDEFAWWQLDRAVPRVVLEALAGVLGGLGLWLAFGPAAGIVFAAGWTLIATLVGRRRKRTVEALITAGIDRLLGRPADTAFGRAVEVVVGVNEPLPLARRLGLGTGRIIALFAGLAQGLRYFPHHGLWPAIAQGLGAALAVGLVVGFFTISPRQTPSEVAFDARRSLGAFVRHVFVGLFIGLSAGITVAIVLNTSFGIVVGLVFGVAIGLIDGLNLWLDVSADVTRVLSPRITRRADALAAIARSAMVAIVVGVPTGIAFGFAYGPRAAVLQALGFGLVFALADRYTGISATVWGRYLVAKTWLALRGVLPWLLMRFLDDAHRHGVLRRAGAVYQFRHSSLQDHLAAGAARPELAPA
ncbi:NACHT domain-containing protein [Dactylosporangium sp. NPDC051541]|uniref:NACHT domain-containing protein n=1 Tax=Dactylosporangium sp. NPDC051541 TaxID=3363977 RepID=UPI0037A1D099